MSGPYTQSSTAPLSRAERSLLRGMKARTALVISVSIPEGELRSLFEDSDSRVPGRVVQLHDGRYVLCYDAEDLAKGTVVVFSGTAAVYDAHLYTGWGFTGGPVSLDAREDEEKSP